jgi:hypothetical protein
MIVEVDKSFSNASDSETEIDVNDIVNQQINSNKEKANRINEKDVIHVKINNTNTSNTNIVKEKSLSVIKVDHNLSEIKNNLNKSKCLVYA